MAGLEQQIKAFVRGQGVQVVGVAGPDRLDGPPSLDPTYTLRGAKNILQGWRYARKLKNATARAGQPKQ